MVSWDLGFGILVSSGFSKFSGKNERFVVDIRSLSCEGGLNECKKAKMEEALGHSNYFTARDKMNKAQMKIQQMAFMILAVFLFFVLVALFLMGVMFKDVRGTAENLQREQAISSLKVISGMSELNCDSRESLCLDKDKLRVMSGGIGTSYSQFWPVDSVKVYVVYPSSGSIIKCPAVGCNYYEIYNSGQKGFEEYSTYVSICEDVSNDYEKCEIGKIVVGVKNVGGRN
jgi:hypothetical protein